ncbi:hypothetical protein FSHL1_007059 [Fusarium sambucinum]
MRSTSPLTVVESTTSSFNFSAVFFSSTFICPQSVYRNEEYKTVCADGGSNKQRYYEDAVGDYNEDHINLRCIWFQQLRQSLATLLLQRFQNFIDTVQYFAPANLSKRHGNNSEYPDGPTLSTFLINLGIDSGCEYNDDVFTLISPPKNCFHFACPFEALNPGQYRQCLLKHSLLTMGDVISHIMRHHVEPLYCPICSKTFDTLIHRDHHVIKRSCKLQDLQVPGKINVQQEAALKRALEMDTSDEDRWNFIFTAIFPDLKLPLSPYLDHGRGLAISVAKDFLMTDGRRCVSGFLLTQDPGKNVTGDQHAEATLYQLALDDFFDHILERYKNSDDERFT